MQRRVTRERMDEPGVDGRELGEALGFIRWVNRRLGGESALLGHLQRWSARWPRDPERPVTLLDVGTGSADLPVAAAEWARKRGLFLRIVGLDLHEKTLAVARDHVRDSGAVGVDLVRGDALEIADRFGVGSFDYVHAGLFLHHLESVRVMTALAAMDRVARVGIIWNDLIRSRLAHASIRLLTLGRSEMIRHDARVSVEAGFTRAEVCEMRDRLELTYAEYNANYFTQRFTLAGEKPGGWDRDGARA